MKITSYSLLFVSLAVASLRADEPADSPVTRFHKQAVAPGVDRAKLRLEILDFVRAKAGQPESIQAAAVAATLPSPIDQLNPTFIPDIERFGWQPKELVAVLGEHRGRQGAAVTCLLWTPDRKYIISGGAQGYVRVWRAADLRQEWRLSSGSATTCLTMTDDSKVLAAGNAGGGVYLWDFSGKEPKLTGTHQLGTSAVHGIDFSRDGKMLAAGIYDGNIHLFDLEGPKGTVRTQLTGHRSAVRAVAFAGKTLAGAASDGTIRFWSLPDKEKVTELGSLAVHTGAISTLLVTTTGTQVVAGCDDGSVIRVNLGAKFTKGAAFKTPAAITSMIWSRAGQLTTSHGDNVVRVWGAAGGATPKPVATYEGHFYGVNGIAYSADGTQLATGSSDWTIRLWSTFDRKEKYPLRGHWMAPAAVRFSPSGMLLATGGADRTIRTWEVTKPLPVQTAQFPPTPALYKGEGFSVGVLAFTPDGKALAVSGATSVIKLWDVVKRQALRDFVGHPTHVSTALFSPDGQTLASISGTQVLTFNAQTAKETGRVNTADRNLNSIALSPDARWCLTGTGNYVYEKGKPLMKDGKYVYQDIALSLFDLRRHRLVQDIKTFPVPMGAVGFSLDARTAYCQLWSDSIKSWSIAPDKLKEGQLAKFLTTYGIPSVYSPDGRFAAAGAAPVRILDLEKDAVLKTWTFDEQVYTYNISPDGRYLALTLVTGPVYVLRITDPPMPATGN